MKVFFWYYFEKWKRQIKIKGLASGRTIYIFINTSLCRWLRQHPRVLALPWKQNIRRSEKSNTIDVFVSGVLGNEISSEQWSQHFNEPVEPFTSEERREWLSTLSDVSLSSDAFFPFRDNIDCAKQVRLIVTIQLHITFFQFGVKNIVTPGGSTRDDEIIEACDEYGLILIHSGLRLFHH